MASPFALQWSLDKTANSGLSLSRALIAAATSDNVEPMAVAACEQFGAALAICRDSCAKVERVVAPIAPLTTFMGAYIGYSVGDCATQLVKSVAGVRFMALSAALVTSVGATQGAEVLEVLLDSSAADKTQVPPAGQLKTLLTALEPRFVPLRFLDSVIFCRNLLIQSVEFPDAKTFWKKATRYPDANAISRLVRALSELKSSLLTNPHSFSSLDVKAYDTAPWVIAFTSWFLGTFPSIRLGDGSIIFVSQESAVTIIAVAEQNLSLDVISHNGLDRISNLITFTFESRSKAWSGMASIVSYGQWLRNELSLSSPEALLCLVEILPYATRQTANLLLPSKLHQGDSHEDFSGVDNSFSSFLANPFSQEANIAWVLSLMLGHSTDAPSLLLKTLPEGMILADIPLVQEYLAGLHRTCLCARCNPLFPASYNQCLIDRFWRGIVSLVMDILCLSLFENPDELSVSLDQALISRIGVGAAFYEVVTTGKPKPYNVLELYDWALSLVGHKTDMVGNTHFPNFFSRRRMISSAKGQVVFLKLFSTGVVPKRGYLTLTWARGLLQYRDAEFGAALEPLGGALASGPACERHYGHSVMQPLNLNLRYRLAWRVTPHQGYLGLTAVCRDDTGQTDDILVQGFTIVENIAQSFVLEGCQHPPDTPLIEPDENAMYTGPMFYHSPASFEEYATINCVAVDCNDGLRMLAFGARTAPFPMVLRGNACLACGLAFCREVKSRVLIL